MKTILILSSVLLLATTVKAAEFSETVKSVAPADVTVSCNEPGSWKFNVKGAKASGETGELTVTIESDEPAAPPKFTVALTIPQVNIAHRWVPAFYDTMIPPDWMAKCPSNLASWMPLYTFYSESGENQLTVSSSEVKRLVEFHGGVREEGSILPIKFNFFTKKEMPIKSYSVKVRFDWRKKHYSEIIPETADWMTKTAKLEIADVPEAAFDPLYSTWYCFHQNVFADQIEKECAIAAKLGMKVLIVDDGWETEDTNRGYAFNGDWEVSKMRFPDMAAHVKKVQALGMKYMVWYSVPFVGKNSKNYERFKGKYLAEVNHEGAAILDPRFPEVREFLIGTYEKALKEWNIDGFKLDFIDAFRGKNEKLRGEGRDIDTVPEAVDRLMKDVYSRLNAIKPGILIEFRQAYVGPGIRQYGNMMRVADCPGNFTANRIGISKLRMTSGKSAVHADMLEWNPGETTEGAARNVINCLFSVIQYSMMLRDLPPEHLKMIDAWLKFTVQHKSALLKGGFKPHFAESDYLLLEGWDDKERIFTVHADSLTVKVPNDNRTTYIVNATAADSLVVELANETALIDIYNTLGEKVGEAKASEGLSRIKCPPSGYIVIK